MCGRFLGAIGVLLLVGTVCSARQAAPVAVPAQQASAAPEPVSSPEMDALAAKLAAQIAKSKLKSVVVVGVIGPQRHVTEFGKSLREALSDSLARQAGNFTMMDGAAVRTVLHNNRISEDMLYSDVLGDWIALHLKADALVTGNVDRIRNGNAIFTVTLFKVNKDGMNQRAKLHSTITLTEAQIQAAERRYVPTADEATAKYNSERAKVEASAAKNKNDQAKMAACLFCPKPEYSPQARTNLIRGTVHLLVTIQKDGTADNILVTSPVGYGLDAMAVDSVLTWKFKPATDSQGNPVVSEVPIEIFFTLY